MTLSTNNTASTYQKRAIMPHVCRSYKLAYAHFTPSASFWDFYVCTTCLLREKMRDMKYVCAVQNKSFHCRCFCFRRGLVNASLSCHMKTHTRVYDVAVFKKQNLDWVHVLRLPETLLLRLHIFTYQNMSSLVACVCLRNRSGLRAMSLYPFKTPKLSLRMAVYQKGHVLLVMRGHWERLAAAYKDQPSSRDFLSPSQLYLSSCIQNAFSTTHNLCVFQKV